MRGIENVRLWFSWCVCATCLPAYPWANRAVPRSLAMVPPLHVECSSSVHSGGWCFFDSQKQHPSYQLRQPNALIEPYYSCLQLTRGAFGLRRGLGG